MSIFTEKIVGESLTFDDVLLVPAKSEVLPRDVDVSTRLTKNIRLNIPLVSAAMDTVTTSKLAIALAREGGIGIIHKNMSIQDQVNEVDKVKRSESAIVTKPITIPPDITVAEAKEKMRISGYSGFPVVKEKKLVGMLTNRDVRFETRLDVKVEEIMTKKLITGRPGMSLDDAVEILQQHRVEKLPLVDENGFLVGLITVKDILKRRQFPNACKDAEGRLRVGAAVGVGDEALERVKMLIQVGCDVIVLDSAHGHSKGVLNTIEKIKLNFPEIELIAGNVVTKEATYDLIQSGVSAVKVGVGPGSICTTRVVTGVGYAQISAILQCAEEASKYNIPIIADGGIKYSGDIAKAIAAGAETVMIGSLFAGTEESPGERVLYEGRTFKVYHGMGSLAAMKRGSSDRYFQKDEEPEKLVPEGIEGRVPYRGMLSDTVHQLVGGLRSAMGYCGSENISKFIQQTKFVKITNAGLRESHPHDVQITREAPNYSISDDNKIL
ncbi:MAG: IMP dehydrogenase [bacterium]|nr:IMP dehydrogenase [bacterium]